MNCYTIKDLENLSGIKAHTIRMWEQRYGFLKPCRTCTNIRYYSNEELKKILNIALLNKHGYKVSHIDKMCDNTLKEKILSLTQADAQQEKVINALIQNMVDLNIEAIEETIDSHTASEGIEKTITNIIFPFLDKIGILWLTSHINPAQEHLVSNLIRQKLIAGIEKAPNPSKTNKSVLLFLPEGDYHEIGLLFTYYLFKSKGVNVIYLGADISLEDVEYVVNIKKPDYLYCHIISGCTNFNLEKFIHSLTQKFPSTRIIISGMLTRNYQRRVPLSITFKKSVAEVMDFVSELAMDAVPGHKNTYKEERKVKENGISI